MSTKWNPNVYLKFQKERTQPSIDLVNRIEFAHPKRIVDIGCGPGNSTNILKKRWKDAEIIGIDNSQQMIEKAKQSYPDGTWILANAYDFHQKNAFDIVFSNAVLHWIPNHEKLVPHLLDLMKPNGVIAIQVPQRQSSQLHNALYETASEPEFSQYTQEARTVLNYQTGEYYYNLFFDKVKELYIWETIYYHILETHDDLINWSKSTAMRPFLEQLPNEEVSNEFLKRIKTRCLKEYKKQSDGRILFPFKRLFIMGYK